MEKKPKPPVKTREGDQKSKTGVYVYVRVRPLLKLERLKKNVTHLEGLKLTSDLPESGQVVALEAPRPIGGFDGVFGEKENNVSVFKHAFLPRLSTVMKGGTASLFCYGYTGAGKTHTVFGSDSAKEIGLYRLAADELLGKITKENDTNPDLQKNPLMLQITVAEVYNDVVFDLLGERKKCTLRINKSGQLMVRGTTKKTTLSAEEAKKKGAKFAVVTSGITTMIVQSSEDLDKIQKLSSKHRAVGSSTEHDQSSRSHAIFRLDIVNQPLLDAMNELEETESIKPAMQTEYAKKRTMELRHRIIAVEKKIEGLNATIESMFRKGHPLGGKMMVVDLAGSDSDARDIGTNGHTAQQRKESQAINKSLLALKECIRGLQTRQTKKLPFRNSQMTRLLEEVLMPTTEKDTDSVMLVNVAPPSHLSKKTVNSMRYGQMFAVRKVVKKPVSRIASRRGPSKALLEAKRRARAQAAKAKAKTGVNLK
eukprot:jgi/Bigna1/79048/fgenesh1_pg.59_\